MKSNMKLMASAICAAFSPLFMADAAGAATEAKKPQFCKKSFDPASGVFKFAFGDGESIDGNILDFSEDIQTRLTGHGLLQKGGDSYAGAKGNYVEAKDSLREVLSNLANGEWSGEREGGPRLADLAAAIARIKAVSIEQATAAVEKATDEQRSGWRANAKVKAVMATIAAEKAAVALAAAENAPEIEVNIE